MSHVCDIGRPVYECDGRLTPVRWCPTLAEECRVCGWHLVCPEHGCQDCGRMPQVRMVSDGRLEWGPATLGRDKTPTEPARAVNDARVLGSGAGYIGRHRNG